MDKSFDWVLLNFKLYFYVCYELEQKVVRYTYLSDKYT